MEEFTNEDFIKFIESYKDGSFVDEYNKEHKFYDTITELSRSDTKQADSLIKNSEEMYGLDWIVKASNKFDCITPKSTDALFFKEDNDGNLALHIIEFKFIGKKSHWNKINYLWRDIRSRLPCEGCDFDIDEECFDDFFVRDFKKIKKNFKDPIDVSLQLKPYEVIFITLPKLYEEYCEMNPNIIKKDIIGYLNNIDKYYWAFVGNFSQSEYNIQSKTKHFNEYNERLEMTIFKKARAKSFRKFNKVLEYEILKTKSIEDLL